MAEAMKCGAYPIITDIGALAEVAGEKNASVVPIEGTPTSKGYQVTENFLNNFANACCMALDYYDKEQKYYHEVSKIISDYVSERYNWKRVSEMWKNTIETLTGSTTHSVSFRSQTMDDWIFNEVYVENSYEVDTFNEHDVVIDIGGHAGYFSKLCMDKGCKNIFAYEAEPNNYSLMRSNLSNYNHFAAYNLAVWKTSNDYLEFYTLPNKPNTGLNSFYKTHFEEGQFVPIQVETISLDDILFKFQKVKLLKLDVEGSEYEILMNSKLLHKVEKIVGEYHNGMTPYNEEILFKYLKSNGFKIEKVTQNSESEEQGLSSGTFFAINQTHNKGFGV
jgi:FkbM family methyltransferase